MAEHFKYEEMTDEELIDQLREGDRQVMDYICDKYKNLVRSKAKSMYILGGDSEDLIQEGMIGLFKAIRDYRPEKESSFYHFAELCISRQMYTAIEASNRKKHAPLNSYVSLSEPESGGIGELLEGRIGEILSDLEKEVLTRYIEGKSYQEISDEMGRHVKSIDNALQRIKNKLK